MTSALFAKIAVSRSELCGVVLSANWFRKQTRDKAASHDAICPY